MDFFEIGLINRHINEDDSLDFTENENFSICCWVNTNSSQSSRIIMKRNSNYGNWYSVGSRFNNSNIAVEFSNNHPTNYYLENGNVIFNNGDWHFITVQRTSSAIIKIYIDGFLDTVCSDYNFDLSNTSDLYIGTFYTLLPSEPTFNGKIDDIRIYDRVRNDILALVTDT